MFIYKNWKKIEGGYTYLCRGWLLFGFIPVLVWKIDINLPSVE